MGTIRAYDLVEVQVVQRPGPRMVLVSNNEGAISECARGKSLCDRNDAWMSDSRPLFDRSEGCLVHESEVYEDC